MLSILFVVPPPVSVVIVVERLFPDRFSVTIDLRVQLLHVGLRSFRHLHQSLLVLVRLRLDVRGIRVQNRSAH